MRDSEMSARKSHQAEMGCHLRSGRTTRILAAGLWELARQPDGQPHDTSSLPNDGDHDEAHRYPHVDEGGHAGMITQIATSAASRRTMAPSSWVEPCHREPVRCGSLGRTARAQP